MYKMDNEEDITLDFFSPSETIFLFFFAADGSPATNALQNLLRILPMSCGALFASAYVTKSESCVVYVSTTPLSFYYIPR